MACHQAGTSPCQGQLAPVSVSVSVVKAAAPHARIATDQRKELERGDGCRQPQQQELQLVMAVLVLVLVLGSVLAMMSVLIVVLVIEEGNAMTR